MSQFATTFNAPAMKPLVRFYIYRQEVSEQQRLDFACLLAEKSQAVDKRVAILCAQAKQAALLDERLWTFKAESFIPHCYSDDPLADKANVIINVVPERLINAEVIINLSLEHKVDVPRASERVFEIVNQTPAVLHATRQRFQGYKKLGLLPQTHSLTS